MPFLYSFSVVAPIHLSSPRPSIDFSKFPAFIAPPVAPIQRTVWISSINIIICPFEAITLFNTAFNLSSNSPWNLEPASSELISNVITFRFTRGSGTSPWIIRCANPLAIAVFPTPGSPIITGLFFVL
nr:Uncharacterised protein [Ipomoea batatas]GMD47442.1 Uncharacterised protein [Ipomoea batatas]